MQAVKIYFSHGLESGPNATRMRAMMTVAEAFGVSKLEALDYRGVQEPGQRLAMLKQKVESDQLDGKKIILVGSNMGSWVSGKLAETLPVQGCDGSQRDAISVPFKQKKQPLGCFNHKSGAGLNAGSV